MAGGGYLNIAGQDTGFDGAAMSNAISFTTSDLGTSSMEISLPTMSGKFHCFRELKEICSYLMARNNQ